MHHGQGCRGQSPLPTGLSLNVGNILETLRTQQLLADVILLFAAAQWFPARDNSAPGGHLAKSVDTFGCLACKAGESRGYLTKDNPCPQIELLGPKGQ